MEGGEISEDERLAGFISLIEKRFKFGCEWAWRAENGTSSHPYNFSTLQRFNDSYIDFDKLVPGFSAVARNLK